MKDIGFGHGGRIVSALEDKEWSGLLRLGGFSLLGAGLTLALSVLVSLLETTTITTTQVETVIGTPPAGLTNVTGFSFALSILPNSTFGTNAQYVSAHAMLFETYFLLSALFFAFLIPGVLALYIALRGKGRAPASVGLALAVSGIFLGFMYVPSAFSTIRMLQLYASATSDAARSGFFGAALASDDILNVGSIMSSLLLSGALIIVGYLMTKDTRFGKNMGYLGIFAGLVNVATSFLPYPLSIAGSFLSVFGLVWILISGMRLIKLPRRMTQE